MTELYRYKQKLHDTRYADNKHEDFMREAAKKAGVDLDQIRRLPMRKKDEAIIEMLKKAKEDAE